MFMNDNICDYCHKDNFLSLLLEFFINFVSFILLSWEFHRAIIGSLSLLFSEIHLQKNLPPLNNNIK